MLLQPNRARRHKRSQIKLMIDSCVKKKTPKSTSRFQIHENSSRFSSGENKMLQSGWRASLQMANNYEENNTISCCCHSESFENMIYEMYLLSAVHAHWCSVAHVMVSLICHAPLSRVVSKGAPLSVGQQEHRSDKHDAPQHTHTHAPVRVV